MTPRPTSFLRTLGRSNRTVRPTARHAFFVREVSQPTPARSATGTGPSSHPLPRSCAKAGVRTGERRAGSPPALLPANRRDRGGRRAPCGSAARVGVSAEPRRLLERDRVHRLREAPGATGSCQRSCGRSGRRARCPACRWRDECWGRDQTLDRPLSQARFQGDPDRLDHKCVDRVGHGRSVPDSVLSSCADSGVVASKSMPVLCPPRGLASAPPLPSATLNLRAGETNRPRREPPRSGERGCAPRGGHADQASGRALVAHRPTVAPHP